MKAKLILMCGYPYSGKTFLSKRIAENFNYTRIDIDDIVRENGFRSFDDPEISYKKMSRMFDQYYERMSINLKKGINVISDTSNPSKERRLFLKQLATNNECDSFVIYVATPKDLILKRWQKNRLTRSRMQISYETLMNAFDEMETPDKDEKIMVFDGSTTIDEWLKSNSSFF